MNYNTVFSATRSLERFVSKIFSVHTAVAIAVFIFELACDAYESGQIVRRWYESAREFYYANHETIIAEFEPCVQVVKAATAWAFGVDRMWSAQNLPATIVAASATFADAQAAYKRVGTQTAVLIDTYLMGV